MPSKNQTKKQKTGFTIIEVVLVLAIAGLIFLMVFVALPALQRSQRDTARRQDYADLSAAISNFRVSNNNNLPSEGTLDKSYVNSKGTDPTGKDYTVNVVVAAANNTESKAPDPAEATVYVYEQADCSGTKDGRAVPKVKNSTTSYAIYGYLETGKSYCQANQ